MTAAPRAAGAAARERGATNVDVRAETAAVAGRAAVGRATAEPTKAIVEVEEWWRESLGKWRGWRRWKWKW